MLLVAGRQHVFRLRLADLPLRKGTEESSASEDTQEILEGVS